ESTFKRLWMKNARICSKWNIPKEGKRTTAPGVARAVVFLFGDLDHGLTIVLTSRWEVYNAANWYAVENIGVFRSALAEEITAINIETSSSRIAGCPRYQI